MYGKLFHSKVINSSQSKITSVVLDFDKYQYFIAQIQIIFDISFISASLKSSLFSFNIFLALEIASSNKFSSFIIFHFLELIAQLLREINPFQAKNSFSFSIQEAVDDISKACLKCNSCLTST